MRRVEPDPDKMPEQRCEPRAVSLGQRRLQDRGDIAAQMRVITGAEQDDIDTRLVPDEPVGRIDDAAGAALMHEKTERIGVVGQLPRYQPVIRELAHRLGEPLGAREDVAHGEHQERADAMLLGQRKDVPARVLVHHVERDHDDIPGPVACRALDHLVLGIAG